MLASSANLEQWEHFFTRKPGEGMRGHGMCQIIRVSIHPGSFSPTSNNIGRMGGGAEGTGGECNHGLSQFYFFTQHLNCEPRLKFLPIFFHYYFLNARNPPVGLCRLSSGKLNLTDTRIRLPFSDVSGRANKALLT